MPRKSFCDRCGAEVPYNPEDPGAEFGSSDPYAKLILCDGCRAGFNRLREECTRETDKKLRAYLEPKSQLQPVSALGGSDERKLPGSAPGTLGETPSPAGPRGRK